MKNDKLSKVDDKPTHKARSMYDKYTPLNASRGRILNEIMNVELKDTSLDVKNRKWQKTPVKIFSLSSRN